MHCRRYNPNFLPGHFQLSQAVPQHEGEDPRPARITACVKEEDQSGFKSNSCSSQTLELNEVPTSE